MPNELVRTAEWDKDAVKLAFEYAGFTDAETLSDPEKIEALTSLVPMALKVVDEARDTIEDLRRELDAMRIADIKRLVRGVLSEDAAEAWWTLSIPSLENQTPLQLVEHDRVDALHKYAQKYRETTFS